MVKSTFKYFLVSFYLLLLSCSKIEENKTLKIYGERILNEKGDTVFYTIPSFQFINQDSLLVDNKSIKNKVVVVDFFFTTCPTICPRMKDQMLRVYKKFENTSHVIILSHTIDPVHDTVGLLNDFAYNKLEIKPGIWNFLTGNKDSIYNIAEKYMVVAGEDETEPGGFIHSGKFILLDKKSQIRGYYDGTNPLSVSDLMRDVEYLIKNE